MKSDRLFLALGLPMLMLSPILSAYISLQVPLGEPSILGILLAVFLVCSVSGLAMSALPRLRYGHLVRALVLTVFLAVFFDMTTRSNIVLSEIADSRGIRLSLLVSFCLLIFAIVWLMREKIAPILFVGASVLFVSSILVPAVSASENRQRTVFLVLDELIGLAGMDPALLGAQETRRALEALLRDNGFRYYPNAFSRHSMTQRSLAAVHNYDFDDNDFGLKSRYSADGSGNVMAVSRLLDDARASGHEVGVFQTAHLDFCVPGVARCETFQSFNMAGEFVDYEPTALTGVFTLARAFEGSYSWSVVDRVFSRLAGEHYAAIPTFYDIHAFPGWLQHIGREVVQGTSTFVFVHLLAPHAPSVYDRECRLQERLDAGYRLMEEQGRSREDALAVRERYYGWYFDQTLCLIDNLETFLGTLAQSAEWRDARIVIHGDHGSRISMGSLSENLDEQDLVDNYSTFYAIRADGVAPGADERQTSIQRLTAEYFGGLTAEELGPDVDTVAIDSVAGTTAVRRMPSLERR